MTEDNTEQAVRIIGDLATLRLSPGDVLVLMHPDMLCVDVKQALVRLIKDQFPGHKCIVLDGGSTLGTIQPAP